jgi:hypothetical protein
MTRSVVPCAAVRERVTTPPLAYTRRSSAALASVCSCVSLRGRERASAFLSYAALFVAFRSLRV